MKFRSIVLMLGLLFSVVLVTAQDDEQVCYDHGGRIDRETNTCQINSGIEINIQYPMEFGDTPLITSTIDSFVGSLSTEFLTIYMDSYTTIPTVSFPWVLDATYTVYQHSDQIVTIAYSGYQYTGGAHGFDFMRTFTFDLKTGTQIELMDMFQEEFNPFWTIAPIVEMDLQDQLGDLSDNDWIHDGTGEDPSNYQNFAVTEDELIFFFPSYQVAAYAAGPQEVRIPLEDLNVILAPPFLNLDS